MRSNTKAFFLFRATATARPPCKCCIHPPPPPHTHPHTRSNKDGIPGIPQDVASLQQRAASVALGGAEGVGVGDQALAKARAFLPSEQLEGMSRLAYSLELRVRA